MKLDELGWLHDSDVRSIDYDGTVSGRVLRIEMKCPNDSGYPPWEGKDVTVIAKELTGMRHTVWGVVRPESFDRVHRGVSAEFLAEMKSGLPPEYPVPAIECTFLFHSGSMLEIACESLDVEVK